MSSDFKEAGILDNRRLLDRLHSPDEKKRIFVVPMVDPKSQISNGSLDLRLGTDFIITKRTRYSVIDPLDDFERFQSRIVDYQERLYVDAGNKLILHPNQLVLGCTLEYLRLPNDIAAYVIGRSSWGRLGLIIATATFVHPGFAGVVTLEMVNLGDTPIALYPGVRIAQLVFHSTTFEGPDEAMPKTKYHLSTRPRFSRIYDDDEWDRILRLQDARRKGNSL